MTCRLLSGQRIWEGERDDDGHRTYNITFRVITDNARDGPANVMQCPGLPVPGSDWEFDDDIDVYAWCTWRMKLEPVLRAGDGPNKHWDVTIPFTTKPQDKACRETQFEDPVLEPPRISGGFQKATEERTLDRFGLPITNSAHEMLRGPIVEFDKSRNTVHIEQNVLDLELELISAMNDTLNFDYLWGVIPRGIKLVVGPWERKFHGSCYVYYTRNFDFEVNVRIDPTTGLPVSGHDRDALDEGTKALRGDWNKDPLSIRYGEYVAAAGVDGTKPGDFVRFKDWNGENTKVILDGHGLPIRENTGTGTGNAPGSIHIEGHDESDFLALGIPTSL